MKAELTRRLSSRGVKSTIIARKLGYELRCADPIPYDVEYCRDLGMGGRDLACVGRDLCVEQFRTDRLVV